ncbi:Coq4 family protein [Alkalinema pantanalense CENA528]|uniref:Coq4 family protein n=1 Tax=Alkalinema pantanalense TaxID=1620705 RepID=UPI003D6E847D
MLNNTMTVEEAELLYSPLSTAFFSTDPQLSPNATKALGAFLQLIQNPAEFSAIYDLDEVLRQQPISEIACAYLKAQPPMAALIETRYLPAPPDVDQLLTYPKNSLGYCYAKHLRDQQFEPVFYRQRDAQDDISYITLRRSQTHDIHHVITGFGTDLAGEIGLQAFQLAQMRSPLAIGLITSAIVHALAQPDLLTAIMQQITIGWDMGCQAQPVFAQKWEEAWEKPVEVWRQALNIRAL